MAAPVVTGVQDPGAGRYLIRGSRTLLVGDNLAGATELLVGNHAVPIVGFADAGAGQDAVIFDVPTDLVPSHPDGSVTVQITTAYGTWTSENSDVFFLVGSTDDWHVVADADTELSVREASFTSSADGPSSFQTPGGGAGGPWTLGIDVETLRSAGSGTLSYTAKADAMRVGQLYNTPGDWTNRNYIPPEDTWPAGAVGYQLEGWDQADFSTIGTLHWPATATVAVDNAAILAEVETSTGTTPNTSDPPSGWVGGPDTAIQIRRPPNALVNAGESTVLGMTAVTPADVAGYPLIVEKQMLTMAAADSVTFDLADTDFIDGTFTYLLATDRWTDHNLYPFPPDPPNTGSFTGYHRLATADMALLEVTTTITPPRYRFVFPVPYTGRPPLGHRQRRDGAATAGPALGHFQGGVGGSRPPLAHRQQTP